MLARYCGPGLLGLGITALIAGFMSGMAGNVSAFATVWTYDIYRAFIRKDAPDAHYVTMGRWCTLLGVLVSIGTAYLVMQFHSIMDYVQALFSFFIAPLFGTVLLGMLWKRATPAGGFWGLLAGTLTAIGLWAWVHFNPAALRYVALRNRAQGPGREYVPGAVVVDRLRCCDHRGQSDDRAKNRRRARRLSLRLHRAAEGRRSAFIQAPDFLGRDNSGDFYHSANYFLVGRYSCIKLR